MLEDIELLTSAKNGDENAINQILSENKQLVVAIARKYYLLGGDRDDLIQEGMIGFFRAITSFDAGKNTSFKNYAIRLIERSIISAIRHANNCNNQLSSNSLPLFDSDDCIGDDCPENQILGEERYRELQNKIKTLLSDFEQTVTELYLKGYTYVDIANKLDKTPKSIDNALTRIKNKLKILKGE